MESTSDIPTENMLRFLRRQKWKVNFPNNETLDNIVYSGPDTMSGFHWVHHPVKGSLKVHEQQLQITL